MKLFNITLIPCSPNMMLLEIEKKRIMLHTIFETAKLVFIIIIGLSF